MTSILPPEDGPVKQYLCERLSLSSPDQVERTQCSGIGLQSAQSSYLVTTDDGRKLGIFVKTVDKESNEFSKILEKEIVMYETIIPEVTRFVERNSKDLADQFASCFVKYYGNSKDISDNSWSLFLEDLTQEGNILIRDGSHKSFLTPDPDTALQYQKAVLSKLGMIHGAMYAWQVRCNPGSSPDDMKEKYPALANYPVIMNSKDFGGMVGNAPPDKATGMMLQITTSITFKNLTAHIGDVVPDTKAQEAILATMGKLVSLAKNFPYILAAVRDQESEFTCPILGDVNGNNIAFRTKDLENLIFYDFGLAGFGSPLMDVQWFSGEALQIGTNDDLMKQLLDEYTSKFSDVSEKLGVKMERASLIKEYYATKIGQNMLSFIIAAFALFYKLKTIKVPPAVVGALVGKMMKYDAKTNQNEIRTEMGKHFSKEEMTRLVMFQVKALKNIEDYIGDMERLVHDKD